MCEIGSSGVEFKIAKKSDRYLPFSEKLKIKFGNKFTLLSEYISSQTNVTIKCSNCGLISERNAGKLLYLGGCKGCRVVNMTKTHEQFVLDVASKHGDKYTVIGKYIKDKEKVLIRHNECGSEYLMTASSLMQTGGCKICQPKKLRKMFAKSHSEFKQFVFDKVGTEYSLLSEYISAHEPITFKHNVCGFEYTTQPSVFKRGRRCPKCAIEGMRTHNPLSRQIGKNIRSHIIHVLKGRQKANSTIKLLGCSIDELKMNLSLKFTDGMTWDNYGKKDGWQVDHIKPCASFDFTNEQDQRECFHYTNLQPLWAKDNASKSSWYNGVRYDKRKKSST